MKRNETDAPDRAGAAGRGREAAGNVAKLREALEAAHDTLCDIWRHEAQFMQPHLAQVVLHTGKAVEEALKAPPRNCDLYATEDAAFSAWAQKTGALKGHVGVEAYYQYLRWLFARATPEK